MSGRAALGGVTDGLASDVALDCTLGLAVGLQGEHYPAAGSIVSGRGDLGQDFKRILQAGEAGRWLVVTRQGRRADLQAPTAHSAGILHEEGSVR
ncbi:MAG: hypothetical protein KatS3mg024_1821 [Armatimonadota bacterium]|nr:MAG: hypothetical protein KatS3mg024_1821 [Armatimonadota bacterium]